MPGKEIERIDRSQQAQCWVVMGRMSCTTRQIWWLPSTGSSRSVGRMLSVGRCIARSPHHHNHIQQFEDDSILQAAKLGELSQIVWEEVDTRDGITTLSGKAMIVWRPKTPPNGFSSNSIWSQWSKFVHCGQNWSTVVKCGPQSSTFVQLAT